MAAGSCEAGGLSDSTIDVDDDAARFAHQMVVVIAYPGLISSH